MINCPECGNTDWLFQRGYSGSREEPSEPAGMECLQCSHFIPDEPDPDSGVDEYLLTRHDA